MGDVTTATSIIYTVYGIDKFYLQWSVAFNNYLFLYLIFAPRAECTEEAVPAPTSMDQMVQQPPCYLEEEEEIYISEQMQEITDGIIASLTQNMASIKLCVITKFNLLFSSALHPGAHWGPVYRAWTTSYIHCHHHRKTCSHYTVVQGKSTGLYVVMVGLWPDLGDLNKKIIFLVQY